MASPRTGSLRTAPVVWLMPLLCVVLVVSACGDGGSGSTPTPITIGVILDRSGPSEQVGAEQEEALTLAVDVVNQRGGVGGRTVELTIRDDQSSPATAADLATELTEAGVSVLIGSSAAPTTQAIRPIAEQAYVPLLAPVAGNGVDQGSGWVFSTGLDPDLQVSSLMAQLASMDMGSVGLLLEDSAASSGVADLAQDAADAEGITISGEAEYAAAGTDLAHQIQSVVAAAPEAVLIWGRAANLGSVASAYRAMGGSGQLAFSAEAASPHWVADLGDVVQGAIAASSPVLVADQMADEPVFQPAKDFASQFSGQYGEPPSVAAGYAYDAITLALQAIENTEPDARPRQVRDRLETTGEFAGVTGGFVIGAQEHSALPPTSAVVVTCSDGTWVPAAATPLGE